MVVKTEDDVMTASSGQVREEVVPIFQVSSVTGEGLQLLARYLHVLPPGCGIREKERLDQVFAYVHVQFFTHYASASISLRYSAFRSCLNFRLTKYSE